MPELTRFTKDPNAVLDYSYDYIEWLDGDTISSHLVTVAAPVGDTTPLTVNSSSVVGSKVVMWLGGGTVGTTYLVTVHIVTSAGRADDRTTRVVVVER